MKMFCTAIRIATEKGQCNIIKLNLSFNEFSTFNVEGSTQLEWLKLFNNQLIDVKLLDSDDEKMQFNEKVDWAVLQLLSGEKSDVIESELKSELEEGKILLTPKDSV